MHLNSRVPAMPRTVSPRTLGWLGVALMLAVALVPWAGARSAFGASVAAIPINSGNPTCASLDDTYAGGQTWLQTITSQPPVNGSIVVGGFGSITISNFATTSFD